ncbi:hypothetical protein OROHE_007804 [Orobanche hederae]
MENPAVAIDLVEFLNASPTAFHAVDEAKKRLRSAGYEQVSERDDWKFEAGKKYFFTRNHSTIVAFAIGKKYIAGNGFCIIGAHTDSPCLKLKPVTKVSKGGYLEVGVQPYGGGLWHTWFDRDLAIAGRVIVRDQKDGCEFYSHRLVRIEEPIMRIPTLAIHLDREVNDGFKVNKQTHLAPVLATSVKGVFCSERRALFVRRAPRCALFSAPRARLLFKAELNKLAAKNGSTGSGLEMLDGKTNTNQKHHPLLLQLIAAQLGCEPDEICDFELQAYDTQKSVIAGAMKEFIFSGRLDNLCMSYCSLKALIDSTSSEMSLEDESGVRMVALFDHEEVGSDSAQGAGSPVMLDALSRITISFCSDSKVEIFRQKFI